MERSERAFEMFFYIKIAANHLYEKIESWLGEGGVGGAGG